MPWVKGQSGNPAGRQKSIPEHVKKLREESTEKFLACLREGADRGESWAVTLGLHYCLGKPAEHVTTPEDFTTEQLEAELDRRIAANAYGGLPADPESAGALKGH